MPICIHCKANTEGEVKFCGSCGAFLIGRQGFAVMRVPECEFSYVLERCKLDFTRNFFASASAPDYGDCVCELVLAITLSPKKRRLRYDRRRKSVTVDVFLNKEDLSADYEKVRSYCLAAICRAFTEVSARFNRFDAQKLIADFTAAV